MRAALRRLAFALAALSCACSSSPEDVGSSTAAYTTQCGTTTVEGVDISSSQSPVNWTSVLAANRHFAFIKATQGTSYTSANFATQYAGAKAAGVYRSAYHFFDPTVDGVAQANHFLATVGTIEPDDLPPMLDVECPDGDNACLGYAGGTGQAPAATIVSRALDWLSTVATKTGKKPIVYSFPSYFPGLGVADSGLAAYPLFIATISNCASVPAPWSQAAFWQYSWTGTVNGIPGQVDMDRFFGSLSDLQTFALACHAAGAACAANADCCSAAPFCNAKQTCAACLDEGEACTSDADCCGLSVCDSAGTCSANPLPAQTTGNRWITAVSWPETGEAQIFVRGQDGTLLHLDENGGAWSAPASLGHAVGCGSAASFWLKNKSSRVGFPEVFSPGANGGGALDDSYDDATKSWSAPVDFAGGGLSNFVSLPWPDGHVEVLAHASDGSVWHRLWDFAASAWSDWSSMGGSLADTPTAIVRGDGQAELFAIDAAGLAWHDESGPFPGGWSGWRLLLGDPGGDAGPVAPPALASRPVPVRTPDGNISIFATTTSGSLVSSTRATDWAPFATIASGVMGEPSVVVTDAQPEVFVRDPSGAIVHTTPAGSLAPLFGQSASVDPWAWQRLDGSVELFAAKDGQLSHLSRDAKGTWGSWTPLGAIDACDGDVTPGTPNDSGCSCAAAGGTSSPRALLGVLLAIGLAFRRASLDEPAAARSA